MLGLCGILLGLFGHVKAKFGNVADLKAFKRRAKTDCFKCMVGSDVESVT